MCLRDAAPDAANSGLNSLAVLLLPGRAVHVAHALAQVEAGVFLVVDTFNLDQGCAHVLSVASTAEDVLDGNDAVDDMRHKLRNCDRSAFTFGTKQMMPMWSK